MKNGLVSGSNTPIVNTVDFSGSESFSVQKLNSKFV